MKSDSRPAAFIHLHASTVPTPAAIDALSAAELDATLTAQGFDLPSLDHRIAARGTALAQQLAARPYPGQRGRQR
jgi:hypothetical protein